MEDLVALILISSALGDDFPSTMPLTEPRNGPRGLRNWPVRICIGLVLVSEFGISTPRPKGSSVFFTAFSRHLFKHSQCAISQSDQDYPRRLAAIQHG